MNVYYSRRSYSSVQRMTAPKMSRKIFPAHQTPLRKSKPIIKVVGDNLELSKIKAIEDLIKNSAIRLRKSTPTVFPFEPPEPLNKSHKYKSSLLTMPHTQANPQEVLHIKKPIRCKSGLSLIGRPATRQQMIPRHSSIGGCGMKAGVTSQTETDLCINRENRCVSAKPLLRNERESRLRSSAVQGRIRQSLVTLYEELDKRKKDYSKKQVQKQEALRKSVLRQSGRDLNERYDNGNNLISRWEASNQLQTDFLTGGPFSNN